MTAILRLSKTTVSISGPSSTNRYEPYTWDGVNWREGTDGPIGDNYELEPGVGYLIQMVGSPGFTWTYPNPYTRPPN